MWRRTTVVKKKPLNPFSKGRLNQGSGARFESIIRFMAMRDGLMIISNGLRAKRYADKVVAEKSNVDFLILGEASLGQVAFVDGKAFAGKRFGRSMINACQLYLCQQYAERGFCAGFVVHLKEADHVGFYSAEVLSSGGARQGFGPDDGVCLGNAREFSLLPLWGKAPSGTSK